MTRHRGKAARLPIAGCARLFVAAYCSTIVIGCLVLVIGVLLSRMS